MTDFLRKKLNRLSIAMAGRPDTDTEAAQRACVQVSPQKGRHDENPDVGLTDVVPFLAEDELRKKGGNYSKDADWQSYSVHDGNLITGQNPASSEGVAKAVVKFKEHPLLTKNIRSKK